MGVHACPKTSVPNDIIVCMNIPVKISCIFKVDFNLSAVFVNGLAHGVYRKDGGQV